MEITINCRLSAALAKGIRGAREDLTRRWLDRIADRVALDPNRIFPTEELLNHVPLLMDGIAAYLEDPADEISADMPVIAKAIELGELRYSQNFAAHEILKEYEIMGGVLFAFIVRTVDDIDEPCTRGELFACAHRLFRAVSVIQQVTTTHYLRMADTRVSEREERLRSFNRMVTHELKNAIGAVQGAGQLLLEDWVAEDAKQRGRFVSIVLQNADAMRGVLDNLISLSETDPNTRRQRHVLLAEAASEAGRQLREMARARGVELRIAEDLPPVEVNAAAVELCLTNYISNAIKYSDPEKTERWVEVDGAIQEDQELGAELVVRVRDNGIGVPEAARADLFQQFYRAHGETVTGVEGTGLGLSIVRDTIAAVGGRAWAEFWEDGSVFSFAVPARRESESIGTSATTGEEVAAQPGG
jgi:signal transduction histidine kinase